MADESTGAHGSEQPGGAVKPFRIFTTEDEFNAYEAKVRQMAERRAKALSADERATLEATQAELEQRRIRDEEMKGNYEKAKAQIEETWRTKASKAEDAAKKARDVLHEHLVNAQLRALAKAHGAYSEEDVVARLSGRIFVDENFQVRVRTTDGDGAVQDGVSLESAVVDLLKANPHLVKATGSGRSAGTTGGASMGAGYTGSPAHREAQARYDEAMKAAEANPSNPDLMAAVLTAKAALKQAAQ